MEDWFADESSVVRDENAEAAERPPKRRLSKRQVLASLDNLPSALDCHGTSDVSSFKILVIGNSKCGKTSIIRRYASDSFTDDYNITLGADYTKKVVDWSKDEQIRLQLWDIAGQDRFALLTRPYFRNASAAVIVCDVTRPLTLDAVRDWKRELDEKMATEGEIPCILLANKCDQLKGVQEALEIGARIENTCAELGFSKWFITSAKSNENITDAMTFLLTVLTKANTAGATTKVDLKDTVKDPRRRSSLKLGNGNLTRPEAAPAVPTVNITPVANNRRGSQSAEGGCSLA